MTATVAHHVPKGRNFVRALITKSVSKGSPLEYAAKRWGQFHGGTIAKAAVSGIVSDDLNYLPSEFFDAVKQGAIIGKASGFRECDFNIRTLAVANRTSGYWVSQSNPKPLSKPVLAGDTLNVLKVAAIIVVTKESIQTGGVRTESGLQTDLQRACIELLDESFIDVNFTGTLNESPASITSSATPIAATNDAAADVQSLIEVFEGDLSASYFCADPIVAASLALARDSGGGLLFPDVGVRGGQILGVPVIVSRSSPRDSNGGQLTLFDPSSIALALGDLRMEQSQAATLIMADDPDGPSEQVSLFQTNSVAFLCEIEANWKLQHSGAVAVLTGAAW